MNHQCGLRSLINNSHLIHTTKSSLIHDLHITCKINVNGSLRIRVVHDRRQMQAGEHGLQGPFCTNVAPARADGKNHDERSY
jgi:hypothetical protein